jgi:hypothetical protein
MSKYLPITVLESRWYKDGNHSVKGFFDNLALIHRDNPAAYHYEMFNNKESIKEIICRIQDSQYGNCVYIGAHGSQIEIFGAGENKISRTEIRNIFNRNQAGGVYFAACEFMNVGNASFFLLESAYISPWWFAGFSKSTEWMTSSLFDTIFFDIYLRTYGTELQKITKTAKIMRTNFSGYVNALEFKIFTLQRGRYRTMIELISGEKWRWQHKKLIKI